MCGNESEISVKLHPKNVSKNKKRRWRDCEFILLGRVKRNPIKPGIAHVFTSAAWSTQLFRH